MISRVLVSSKTTNTGNVLIMISFLISAQIRNVPSRRIWPRSRTIFVLAVEPVPYSRGVSLSPVFGTLQAVIYFFVHALLTLGSRDKFQISLGFCKKVISWK